MSGRCKACDAILSEQELKNKWPGTNEYCDLCFYCQDSGEKLDYDDTLEFGYQIDLVPDTLE